jgi:hypothetical protein
MGNIPNGSTLPAPRLVESFNSIIGTGKIDDRLRELGGVLFLASEHPHMGQKMRTGYWEATSGSKQGCVLPWECPRAAFSDNSEQPSCVHGFGFEGHVFLLDRRY